MSLITIVYFALCKIRTYNSKYTYVKILTGMNDIMSAIATIVEVNCIVLGLVHAFPAASLNSNFFKHLFL